MDSRICTNMWHDSAAPPRVSPRVLLWWEAFDAHVPANSQDDATHNDVRLDTFHHQLVHIAHVFAYLNGSLIPWCSKGCCLISSCMCASLGGSEFRQRSGAFIQRIQIHFTRKLLKPLFKKDVYFTYVKKQLYSIFHSLILGNWVPSPLLRAHDSSFPFKVLPD